MTPAPTRAMRRRPEAPGPARPVAFPMSVPPAHRRCTYNGSAAIHAALQALGLSADDAVLLPAYCCGAELGPFEHLGCRLLFHDVDADLQVDPSTIAAALDAQPTIRLLFVTHYLGVPQRRIESLASLCRERGVALLEDCAHALFAEHEGHPVGSFGDCAIFSARKSLPMSEGGVLVARLPLESLDTPPRSPPGLARLGRVAYSMQQGARSGVRRGGDRVLAVLTIACWVLPSLVSKLARRSGLWADALWSTPEVEGVAATPVYGWGMSEASRRLLVSSVAAEVRRRRRANHALWAELVRDIDGARPLHERLPEGACPLYFAIRVRNPAACVAGLAVRDIEAFDWWRHLSPAIHWPSHPIALHAKRSIVTLPVHQQLGADDIRRMARCLRECLAPAAGAPEPTR